MHLYNDEETLYLCIYPGKIIRATSDEDSSISIKCTAKNLMTLWHCI